MTATDASIAPYTPIPDRAADWHTISGVPVYCADPDRTVILSRDLFEHANGSSRYNGAPFVTVLQHSRLVAALAEADPEIRDPDVIRWCAVHDLAEVYTGEVIRGIKRHLGPAFKGFETQWERRVFGAVMGISEMSAEMKGIVKHYDLRALRVEMELNRCPALSISSLHAASPTELQIGATVMGAPPAFLWAGMCALLPRLKLTGPL